jgi:hypothetical protein
VFFALASPAEAAVAPSRGRKQARSVRKRSFSRVRGYLHRKKVERRLEDMGMDPHEVSRKLDKMNDDEIFDLSRKVDELDSGRGDCEDLLIAVLVARVLLIIIFLPFYLMWLMMCESPCCGC